MSVHGYVPYQPNERTQSVIRAANYVLREYEAWNSPLTVRQVFYRLVAEFGFDKTEQAYGSLIGYLARARRAYMRKVLDGLDQGLDYPAARDTALDDDLLIPFSWVRDDKGQSVKETTYDGEDDFLQTVRRAAEAMKLARMKNQPINIELWCEAGGMVPLLNEIAEPFAVQVSSGGGYDSVTAKHQLAQRVIDEASSNERATVILHIGDFDPSGEGMFETLRDDVTEMVAAFGWRDWLTVQRVALTEEQVIEWEVETAPSKPLDSRRKAFIAKHPTIREHLGTNDITAQLEALTPPDLRRVMLEALNSVISQDLYDEVLAEEEQVRASVLERLN